MKGETPPPPAAPPKGVDVTPARRETALRLWRGTVKVGVGLLIFSGFMNTIANPIMGAIGRAVNPPAAAAPQLDQDAARSTAATTVADWLTYNPQQVTAYRSTIARQFTGTGDAVAAWTGSAWMAPDLVMPGAVITQPGNQFSVAVTARVKIATPDKSEQPAPTQTQAAAGDPGNDSTPPDGFTVTAVQWLHLLVPINTTPAGFTASAAGPVLSSSTAPRTTPAGPGADNEVTDSTKAWATSLFTAYAGTDPTALGYLTATELPMPPLAGQVTLSQVNSWSVQSPAEGQTDRLATAVVTWKIPNTDMTVKQSYTVELTRQGQRWFAKNLTTTPTTTPGGTA